MVKIYIAADHAGYKLKEKLKTKLKAIDLSPEFIEADDYPDRAFAVAHHVALEKNSLGVLVCGSAEGVCIAANKVNGIRAVIANTEKLAKLSKEHNDANILCLSGWFNKNINKTLKIIKTWIKTKFSQADRHKRRINKIHEYENIPRLIIPAIITNKKNELKKRIDFISQYTDNIHLDVMDGEYVQNKSLMFKLPKTKLNTYIHLMIENPYIYIKKNIPKTNTRSYIYVNSDSITNYDFNKLKTLAYKKGYKFGIVLNPDDKIPQNHILENLDSIVVMTVYPGRYGSKFQSKVIKKLKKLRKLFWKPILVDGSINNKTIEKVSDYADSFCVGSYLKNKTSFCKKYLELLKKIK